MPEFARPIADVVNEGWTGTPADIGEVTPNLGTVITSPVAPAGERREVVLSVVADPHRDDGHLVRYWAGAGRVGTRIDFFFQIRDELGSIVQAWNHVDISPTMQQYEMPLVEGAASMIDDYGNIRVNFWAVQEGAPPPPPNNRRLLVSWSELSVPAGPVADVRLRVAWARLSVPSLTGDSPLSLGQHPRMGFVESGRVAIRSKIEADYLTEYQDYNTYLAGQYGVSPLAGLSGAHKILGMAFMYQMRQAGTDGSLVAHHPMGITGALGITPLQFGQRAVTALVTPEVADMNVQVAAPVYDWCHALLTPAQRTTIVNRWAAYYTANVGSEGSTPVSNTEIQNRSRSAFIGLAIANEGIQDAVGTTIVDRITNGLVYGIAANNEQGMIDTADWYAGSDGGHSGGFSYVSHGEPDSPINQYRLVLCVGTALAMPDVFTPPSFNGFRTFPVEYLYRAQPDRKIGTLKAYRILRTHHEDNAQFTPDVVTKTDYLVMLEGLYRVLDPTIASLCRWLIDNTTAGIAATAGNFERHYLYTHFLFGTKQVTGQSPAALGYPLTKRFSPMGLVVMRSGWLDPKDSYFSVEATEYTRRNGAYSERNSGAWTYSRRGPLFIHSGTTIHHTFEHHTVACNVHVFVPPQPPPQDYHQRYDGITSFISSLQATQGSTWDMGGIKRFLAYSPGLREADYLYADLTRAYYGEQTPDGGKPPNIRRCTRQVVNFRRADEASADRMVFFDRTETVSPLYEDRNIIHVSQRPTAISGTPTAGPSRGPSGMHGKTSYTAHPGGIATVLIENPMLAGEYGDGLTGKAWVTVVLPVDPTVIELGGANKDGIFHAVITAGRAVPSMTRAGTVVSVTTTGPHGFLTGQSVWFRGATQAEYNNQDFVITSVPTTTTFTYTIATTPATATGAVFVLRSISHEFEGVYGTVTQEADDNYTLSDGPYVGQWRLELLDPVVGTDHEFLWVVEGARSDQAAKTATALINGTNFWGVVCGTVIALFAKKAVTTYTIGTPWVESRQTTGAFTIPTAGSYHVHLADLPSATARTLTITGGSGNTITVLETGSGAPFITSTAGTLNLRIVTNGANRVVTVT